MEQHMTYDDTDIPFVGRVNRLEEIKTKITHQCERRRLIQICGPPMLGKSRLAQQVISELRHEARDREITNFTTHLISLRGLTNLESTKLQLAVIFDMPLSTPSNFIKLLGQHFRESNIASSTYLIVLDNCESMSENSNLLDEFMDLVGQIIRATTNVTIIMTSNRILTFMRLDESKTWLINLEPLNENDAETLLRNVTPNVEMNSETRQTICNLCYRYPYIIIFVGRILNLQEYDSDEVITVLSMHQPHLFGGLENDGYCMQDRPSTSLYNLLRPLSDMLKKTTVRFAYFPQSFDAEAASYVGGYSSVIAAKSQALLPLKGRVILDFNPENRRFMMHSVVRDFLNCEVIDINELAETRSLFAHWFGEMLINVNSQLERKPPQRVLREMMDDWPNIEHLLQEAVHCSDSGGYAIYMKIAGKAEQFINRYMPQNGVSFFRALLDYARNYGIDDDVPILLANLGNTMFNTTNIGSKESIKPLKKAYRMMMESGRSTYHLRYLITNMAWIYYRMGKTHKALRLVHRIVPDFVIQMGDVISGDGTGSQSIYGEKFVDENFDISHRAAGYVSMANTGKDSNGSQFFVMLNRARWLDGRHVVFGKVVSGMEVIQTIGDVSYNKQTGEPKKRVKVVDCGVKGLKVKYTLTDEEARSDEDIEVEREYE